MGMRKMSGKAWGNALGGWRRQPRGADGRFGRKGGGAIRRAKALRSYQKFHSNAAKEASRNQFNLLQGNSRNKQKSEGRYYATGNPIKDRVNVGKRWRDTARNAATAATLQGVYVGGGLNRAGGGPGKLAGVLSNSKRPSHQKIAQALSLADVNGASVHTGIRRQIYPGSRWRWDVRVSVGIQRSGPTPTDMLFKKAAKKVYDYTNVEVKQKAAPPGTLAIGTSGLSNAKIKRPPKNTAAGQFVRDNEAYLKQQRKAYAQAKKNAAKRQRKMKAKTNRAQASRKRTNGIPTTMH